MDRGFAADERVARDSGGTATLACRPTRREEWLLCGPLDGNGYGLEGGVSEPA